VAGAGRTPPAVGALALGGAIVGLGLFFLVGAFAVPGEAAYAGVGPRVFPVLIGAGLIAAGLAFLAQVARSEAGPPERAGAVNRAALLWIAGGLAAVVVAIEALGFPLAAALLFVTTSRACGSRRRRAMPCWGSSSASSCSWRSRAASA
jgi:putative tricarboxylic transport membrane protein